MSKAYSPQPVGVRVRVGDSVGLLAWSNVAFTLRCNVSFLRDGERDPVTLNTGDAIVTSNRAVSAGSLLTFTDPGVIQAVSCATVGGGGAGPTQRGQCFAQVVLTGSGSAIGVYQTLFQGYVYTGQVGALGQVVEPGPAGGHGAMNTQTTADPAAGSEVPALAVPTGAIWRVHTMSVQLVQGITQTPLPTLRILDPGGTVTIAQVPITPTAISASSTAQLTWARGAVQTSFTAIVGDEFHIAPMPYIDLIAGDQLVTVTDGIGANTNYGPATYFREEWVMPN